MPISPGRLIDHLREDVRHAFRGIRRSPGFAATVVITLGLGIGANEEGMADAAARGQ